MSIEIDEKFSLQLPVAAQQIYEFADSSSLKQNLQKQLPTSYYMHGGHQLLTWGPHIITGGLELLIGGLHIVTGGLQLLCGGLEVILGGDRFRKNVTYVPPGRHRRITTYSVAINLPAFI